MEQETDIEVLVAGPEHEVYVDTILETIAEAAKMVVSQVSAILRHGKTSNM